MKRPKKRDENLKGAAKLRRNRLEKNKHLNMVRRSKRGEGNFDRSKIEKKNKYICKGFEIVKI